MDVDYSNGGTLPVNQQLLLSGSAVKFEVPDSNYTAYRSVALRYDGSKTSSPGFNKPIYNKPSDRFINQQFPTGSTPSTQSQEPNASKYSNWFIYFDYIETAKPEIPFGGNVHAVYAINTEGQAISLKGDNEYVDYIASTFSPGISASIVPTIYAAGTKNPQVVIFDGGSSYTTVCTLTGSGYGLDGVKSFGLLNAGGNTNATYFTTGSTTASLYDNLDTSTLDLPFSSTENEWMRDGVLQTNQSLFFYVPAGGFGIYNTISQSIIFNSLNSSNTVQVPGVETLFPIQSGDFIRFGDSRITGSITGSYIYSGSLDSSYGGLGLYTILSASREPAPATPSELFLTATMTSSIFTNILGGPNEGTSGAPTDNTVFYYQNWRIFRRIPNENNIIITSLPSYTAPGLLIPENFNPAYNPYDLAREAGVI